MEYKVDEILKTKIQNNRYKKQEWSKLRYIETFLYVLSIYVALFSIFYVVNTPTFSLFYGNNGSITTSGRILSLSLIAFSSYILLYIPHFIIHIYLLFQTGKNILTRRKEKFKLMENDLEYSYIDLINKNKKTILTMNLDDLEKISYMEEIKKIVLVGKSKLTTIDLKTNEIVKEEEIDNFDLFAYFKPDLLKEFESKNIKIEINFCL